MTKHTLALAAAVVAAAVLTGCGSGPDRAQPAAARSSTDATEVITPALAADLLTRYGDVNNRANAPFRDARARVDVRAAGDLLGTVEGDALLASSKADYE